MSQNAPWSAGGSDEPYTEPADPWGDANTPDAGWAATTPVSYPLQSSAPLNVAPPQQAPDPARNTPIIALVVVLGLLIAGGLVVTSYLWFRPDKPTPTPAPPVAAASSPAVSSTPSEPAPTSSSDARFVTAGQCVQNDGSSAQPRMKIVACGGGTYKVLRRIDGRTTGRPDAESKCKGIKGYTQWYFYDSELDSLDFVLCLSEV